MSWGYTAVAGAVLVSGAISADAQKSAANKAASAQAAAGDASISESQRQFDEIQKLLEPYTTAGTGALSGQQALLGLSGSKAQKDAISALSSGPQMSALVKQGENAILQNAAATGGLRGGNVQAALAQFRPQILSGLINQQYANLGGLTSIGQNAAAGVGNAGMQTSGQIINALQQTGAAQAGSALAAGQAQANMWGGIGSTATTLGTLKLLGKF